MRARPHPGPTTLSNITPFIHTVRAHHPFTSSVHPSVLPSALPSAHIVLLHRPFTPSVHCIRAHSLAQDWDDEDDGDWEAPLIDNPEFKGEWHAKKIDNPAYKGEWKPKTIANPKFEAGVQLAAYDSAMLGCVVQP